MTKPLPGFSELVTGYEPAWPQTGDELLEANPDGLDQRARDLRRHLLLAVQASGSQMTLGSPLEIKQRLERGHLQPASRKWATYALDARHRRVMVPSPYSDFGGYMAKRWVTRKVPDIRTLHERVALPEGGTYLILYGGGPEILEVRDKRGGGVSDDLAVVVEGCPVADVLFWDVQPAGPAALFSLRAGIGDREGAPVEFPGQRWRDTRGPWPTRATTTKGATS